MNRMFDPVDGYWTNIANLARAVPAAANNF